MLKEKKTEIINEIACLLSNYNNIYVADMTGLSVHNSNDLRRICFETLA